MFYTCCNKIKSVQKFQWTVISDSQPKQAADPSFKSYFFTTNSDRLPQTETILSQAQDKDPNIVHRHRWTTFKTRSCFLNCPGLKCVFFSLYFSCFGCAVPDEVNIMKCLAQLWRFVTVATMVTNSSAWGSVAVRNSMLSFQLQALAAGNDGNKQTKEVTTWRIIVFKRVLEIKSITCGQSCVHNHLSC